jgi:hypothetical protein
LTGAGVGPPRLQLRSIFAEGVDFGGYSGASGDSKAEAFVYFDSAAGGYDSAVGEQLQGVFGPGFEVDDRAGRELQHVMHSHEPIRQPDHQRDFYT